MITFIAADDTQAGLSASESVMFTINPEDHLPELLDIPDQIIEVGSDFPVIDLDDYLIESDGDETVWSWTFLDPVVSEDVPEWQVDPSDFEQTMTLTTIVTVRGELSEGPDDILAAFYEDECRGIVNPINILDGWYFFLTIYSNNNGEELTFKYYDSENAVVVPVVESITFVSNAIHGNPDEPEHLHAEFLRLEIDDQNQPQIEIVDPDWLGSEMVVYTVTDVNTLNQYSASDIVTYTVASSNDLPPFIQEIPDQTTLEDVPFPLLDLDDYLLELDGDEVIWSYGGNDELLAVLDDANVLTVSAPYEHWFGSEIITLVATDNTQNQLSDLRQVQFNVESQNDAPILTSEFPDLELILENQVVVDMDVFIDVENDPVLYQVISTDESVLVLNYEFPNIELYGAWMGSAQVVVTASDNSGGVTQTDFNVEVICGTVVDCAGVCGGEAFTDSCGECVGGTTGLTPGYTLDCNNDCSGTAYFDDCNVCSGGNTGHTPNSDIDDCGVCFGENSEMDCNGDCFGLAFLDDCGVCSEGNSEHIENSDKDCTGLCFGSAFLDDCGYCVEGTTGLSDLFADQGCGCNVPGPITVCEDWDGDGYGESGTESEYCEYLGLNLTENSMYAEIIPENWVQDCSDQYDDGIVSILFGAYDNSGQENGTLSIRYESDVEIFGFQFNISGITIINCQTDNEWFEVSVNPDNGQVIGLSFTGGVYESGSGDLVIISYEYSQNDVEVCLSEVIVAAAPGHTPEVQFSDCLLTEAPPFDCNDVPNGTAFMDDCQVCSGGDTGHIPNSDIDDCGICFGENAAMDCNGDCFGSAFLDICEVCSEGNTGHPAGIDMDCAGVCFGEAYYDDCGVCDDIHENDNETCGGCTDPAAMNFSQGATFDDGSCTYWGDFNGDASTDVTDIILLIDLFLNEYNPTEYQLLTCDMIPDGTLNILDVVQIIHIIIDGT